MNLNQLANKIYDMEIWKSLKERNFWSMHWPSMFTDFGNHNIPCVGFGTVMCGGRGGYICPGGRFGHLRGGYRHLRGGYLHLRVGRRGGDRVGTLTGGDLVGTHRGGDRVGVFLGGDTRGGVLFGGLFDRLGNDLSTDGSGNCSVAVDSVVEFFVTNVEFCVSISKNCALSSSVSSDSAVLMSYFHLAFARVAFSQVITLVKTANAIPNVQNICIYFEFINHRS